MGTSFFKKTKKQGVLSFGRRAESEPVALW